MAGARTRPADDDRAPGTLRALGTAYAAGDEWLRPLGLRLTETPGWIPRSQAGIMLVGDMVYRGRRHGREVAVFQDSGSALTAINGSFPERTIEDPQALAALTGEASPWRRVRVESGPDGLTVLRRGNGAGAYMLQDLCLAERAASRNP